mmetsp:Transcript_12776/g.21593  ORF Transcript_12776/g.21593 Transcript_12776/m.21593 type:complete len:171 (-) Transcript_12776:142-654(-)
MYNNWFTKLFMEDPDKISGIFQWYDMFSLQGFDNWFWDSLAVIFIIWWEIIEASQRSDLNDWSYATIELNNFIDKNRLFDRDVIIDPYDFNYWSNKVDGVDCNGIVGLGNYCYCPSQGYNCACAPSDWLTSSSDPKLNCYDHYGYDCSGLLVDGEQNWCQDRSSVYWLTN